MKKLNIILLICCLFLSGCQTPPEDNKSKKAIVVGATSGMGRQVAKLMACDGYEVGLVGRRVELLKSLQDEIPTKTFIKQIDISRHEEAKKQLEDFIKEIGGLDLMLISISNTIDLAKTGKHDWSIKKGMLDVNATGFWIAADLALEQFEKQKSGHLVGVSSISGVRGSGFSPEYSATKAFVSTYLEGVRSKMLKQNIPVYVTDIIPGFVEVEWDDTLLGQGEAVFWEASLSEASEQIYDAIKAKKKKAYITKRWIIIAWLMKILPDYLYNKFF